MELKHVPLVVLTRQQFGTLEESSRPSRALGPRQQVAANMRRAVSMSHVSPLETLMPGFVAFARDDQPTLGPSSQMVPLPPTHPTRPVLNRGPSFCWYISIFAT
jgi:hypothetical protein